MARWGGGSGQGSVCPCWLGRVPIGSGGAGVQEEHEGLWTSEPELSQTDAPPPSPPRACRSPAGPGRPLCPGPSKEDNARREQRYSVLSLPCTGPRWTLILCPQDDSGGRTLVTVPTLQARKPDLRGRRHRPRPDVGCPVHAPLMLPPRRQEREGGRVSGQRKKSRECSPLAFAAPTAPASTYWARGSGDPVSRGSPKRGDSTDGGLFSGRPTCLCVFTWTGPFRSCQGGS